MKKQHISGGYRSIDDLYIAELKKAQVDPEEIKKEKQEISRRNIRRWGK